MSRRIAVDCDGVLCDFVSAFTKLANALRPGAFPPDYVQRRWDFEDAAGLPVSFVDEVWDAIRATPNFWRSVHPLHENIRAMRRFLTDRQDTDVYVVTKRIPTDGDTVVGQTTYWLQQWGLWTPNVQVVATPSGVHKGAIYEALRLSHSIDDYPKNVPGERYGHRAFLLTQPWNADDPVRCERVTSMAEYFGKVEEDFERQS